MFIPIYHSKEVNSHMKSTPYFASSFEFLCTYRTYYDKLSAIGPAEGSKPRNVLVD